MTTPESYIGKRIDFDGAYGNQCVDLVNQYARDNGLPTFTGGAAADMFGQHPEAYDWVQNTLSAVPPAGAIVVWNRGIGPYGHIAIARVGSTNTNLLTEDQNWNGHPYVEAVNHNYNNVIGWGIPKTLNKGTDDMITDNEKDKVLKMGLQREPLPEELNNKDYNNASLLINTVWNNGGETNFKNSKQLSQDLSRANEKIDKLQTQINDLTAKIGTGSSDTQLLNSIGEVLSKLIVRIGLKK